jgi:phage tail-like protein
MTMTLEQILATFAVDAASAVVVAGRYVVIQRDPQPAEGGIAVDTEISFVVVDLDGDGLAIPPPVLQFRVRVRGALVGEYIGGAWVPAGTDWAGSVDPVFPVIPFAGWSVVLSQLAPPLFASEEIVPIVVEIVSSFGWGHMPWGHFPWGHGLGGGTVVEFPWTFECQDLTPPRLLGIVGLDAYTARATFDDSMATSVLAPAAWTVARENVDPDVGASLAVVAVAPVAGDPMRFDLTFQWEQTPGCLYRGTVAADVEDDAGNAIDADYRSAPWSGWAWPTTPGRDWSYWRHMLPLIDREMDATLDLRRFANIIQEVLDLLLREVDRFTDQFDPDLATDAEIDAMLYDLGNPFAWSDLALTALQRRRLVRELVPIYKLKGTALGIEGVCRTLLGIEVRVVDYISDTWCLGLSPLGVDEIAEVVADLGDPYDLSALVWPKHLRVRIDDGPEQDLEVGALAFANPAAATAEELVAALDPQIAGGHATRVARGSPATISGTVAGPYLLTEGATLEVTVDGTPQEVVFHAADFFNLGAATAAEVATLLGQRLVATGGSTSGGMVVLTTRQHGPAASIAVTGGTAAAVLGLAGASAAGSAGENLVVYSATAGAGAAVEVTGGEVAVACGMAGRVAGVGAAILGPGTSYALYCFDIETAGVLPSEVVALVRKIGEYMKPAHTHLINVRPAPTVVRPDGWVLGETPLGDGTILFP